MPHPDAGAWYDLSLLSRLDDKTTGAIIDVMQCLHVDPLTGHLLAQKGWSVLTLPAIAEAHALIPVGPSRVHPLRRGDLFHPEREPRAVLDKLPSALSEASTSRPVPAGAGPARRTPEPGAYGGGEIFRSWDTASKAGELNDYSVCTTWLVRGGAYDLLDVFRDRLGYPDLRRKVIELYRQWRSGGVLIEEKASGEHLVQDLRYSADVFASADQPQGDKTVRAASQAACIEGERRGSARSRSRCWPSRMAGTTTIDATSQFLVWTRDELDAGPRIRSFDDD